MKASPVIGPTAAAAYGEPLMPAPHTPAELTALMGLLTQSEAPIETVVIGHGRDSASVGAAAAFAAAWRARGGHVLDTVDWPESAASWLRPARRLTRQTPDAWVVAGAVLGWAQMSRRLRHSTDWDAARTFAFASLNDSRLPALAGPRVLDGLRGATANGGTWEIS
ncbi:hypothetical protein ABZX75_22850 [Streptomyces sp. NPDC003038]|uniref:hypothetical protein n=1 Tax=unclassified Streptomyces TaxID=2593676 RepID=UPI0033B5B105